MSLFFDPPLLVKRLTATAKVPVRGTAKAVGLDLFADDQKVLEPGERALIKTGIAVAIPEAYYGRVAPRSGLALKAGIDVLAGVIDSDYRGEVGVILINFSDFLFEIRPGDRVAQLILERADQLPVEERDELPDTDRGASGYGSTGK